MLNWQRIADRRTRAVDFKNIAHRLSRLQITSTTLSWALFIAIVAMGALLRFYRISDLVSFDADQGRNASVIRFMMEARTPALVGPSSAFGAYNRGPAFFYFLLPAYVLGNGAPLSGAIWVELVDVAAIVLLGFLGKKLFNPIVGMAAAATYACSGLVITAAHELWNQTSLLPFLVLLMLFCLYGVARHKEWPVMGLLPLWTIAWQFYETVLFLLPVMACVWLWFRPSIRGRFYLAGMLFALVSLAPYLYYEALHNFRDLTALVGYGLRSVGSGSAEFSLWDRGYQLLMSLAALFPGTDLLHAFFLLLAAVGLLGLFIFRREYNRPGRVILRLYLLAAVLFVLWPGPLSASYVAILYPLPGLCVGLGLDALRRRAPSLVRRMAVALFGLVILFTALGISETIRNMPNSIFGYRTVDAVVSSIIQDAQGEPFNFRLVSVREHNEAFESPFLYLFSVHHQLPSARADVPTYIVYQPQDEEDGAARPGAVISGVKIVRVAPPREVGENLIKDVTFTQVSTSSSPWYIPHRAASRIVPSEAGRALDLSGATQDTPQDAVQDLILTPGKFYLVRFLYRNSLRNGTQRVFLTVRNTEGQLRVGPDMQYVALNNRYLEADMLPWQITGPAGNLIDFFTDFHSSKLGTWQTGSFVFQMPSGQTEATLWLRSLGQGDSWFADVELREVIAAAEG